MKFRNSAPNGAALVLLTSAFLLTFLSAGPLQAVEPFSIKDEITNPYCTVPTYATPHLRGPARSYLQNGTTPIILLNSNQTNRSGLPDFFLAHECCHHRLGHLKKKRKPIPSLNGRAVTKEYAKMEADADCCASKILTYHSNIKAIEEAKVFMARFGRVPTGFGYPTGASRYGAIESCHQRAKREFAKSSD